MILAVETSSATASAAVVDPRGAPLGESRPAESAHQARRLLECVDEAFAAAGATMADVETVVCGLGPGTFTGVRIGVATARALAQAGDLQLAGVPSLEALARGLAGGEAGASASTFVPLIDGRRGEVFAAVYRRVGPAAALGHTRLEPLVGLTVVALDGLAAFLAPWPGALVGGDGALLHADRLPPGVVHERAVAAPDALMVARAFLAGSPAVTRGFAATLPIYGREPDAVPGAAPPPGRAAARGEEPPTGGGGAR